MGSKFPPWKGIVGWNDNTVNAFVLNLLSNKQDVVDFVGTIDGEQQEPATCRLVWVCLSGLGAATLGGCP